MLPEEKRAQLDQIVQKMVESNEPDSNIEFVVNDFKNKYSVTETVTEPVKPGVGQKILNAGSAVANFIGAKGITEQFGADIARATAPEEQKSLVQYPSFKKVVGSAIQSGSNLIPGAGVGAKTISKVARGAVTGYGMGVGAGLQEDNKTVGSSLIPGASTAIGTLLPLIGGLTGLSNLAKKGNKVSEQLEQINLRLTPVEKQNLQKSGKQIVKYIADKKIVGTPAQRYQKIDALYGGLEEKVAEAVKQSGLKINKKTALEAIARIPDKYKDNLSEFDSVITKVDKILKTLKSNFGDDLTAVEMNAFKRNEWKNAYNRANTEVVNDVSNEVGHIFKAILDDNVKGLEKLNDEYGKVITARRLLFKASSRNQTGLIGRGLGIGAGSAIGGSLGGPTGAAAGGYVGDLVANQTATPLRSATGAVAKSVADKINKIPVDARGKLLIGRKALLQLLNQ